MNEPRTTTAAPATDGQLRRAAQGIVASYIHGLSERHGHRQEIHEPRRHRDGMST